MRPGERVRRWPVHPPPHPGEALTSWLGRLASIYHLSPRQLLQHNLGPASALLDDPAADDLDWDPPGAILHALAERTGTPVGRLRRMTIGGWVPWLADTLDSDLGAEAFPTYVRQDSVLLWPGEAGRNVVQRWRPWFPLPRHTPRTVRRVCPVCAAEPSRGIPLTARIPLMLSCPMHGRRLEVEQAFWLAEALGEPAPDHAAPEHIVAMDRLTFQGLTCGTVSLPRRSVHVGVWLRLLRTLLDEVSLSTSRVRRHSATALEQIWATAGRLPRAGITVWRPYETFDPMRQEALLEAAATALDLIRTGKITARGSLGPLLTIQPHQPVYEGERPGAAEWTRTAGREAMHQSWAQAQREVEEWFDAARIDEAAARRIFGILTCFSRTREAYDRERDFMIGQGIPASFLPEPEPGRFASTGGVH
ncbi:TniQ family protein [Nonomuraea sp. NPDC050202]|uniref:TniQ family protein n=1 Tax=Nonomuraea sp. NPDC050202 TaxID=3155035 RepID=UPI0033C81DA9